MASTIVSWFKKISVSEDGLWTITRWDRPYGRCIGKWRFVCIMQWKNGFPNLYASEKTIPAVMGHQSWNYLKIVEKRPKCPENQTILDIPSSQVKNYMRPNKIKFWKFFAFSKPIKEFLDSLFSPFEFESREVEQMEKTFHTPKFNRSNSLKTSR